MHQTSDTRSRVVPVSRRRKLATLIGRAGGAVLVVAAYPAAIFEWLIGGLAEGIVRLGKRLLLGPERGELVSRSGRSDDK
jgi:hypothetical protein